MIDFLMNHGSYLGIIIFLILTGAGLPFPEEVAIVAAGLLSSPSIRHLNPWLALACCLLGALSGDCVMYWIGHHFGHRVLREHHWWNRFVKPEREAQMERMVLDHGFKVLFLSRFLVGIRSPVYLSAGILRMPFWRFMLIDLFCATTVISTFFWLSYFFGEAIYGWIKRGQITMTAIVASVVLAVGIYLWRRHLRRVAAQAGAKPRQPADTCTPPASPGSPSKDDEKDRTGGWPGTAESGAGLVGSAEAGETLSETSPSQPSP